MVPTKKFKLKLTFSELILGSQPGGGSPASDFLKAKALENGVEEAQVAEEAQTLPEMMEKATTVFHRDSEGHPLFYNYQIKGMIKEAAGQLNGLGNNKGLKQKVQNTVFVTTRRIPVHGEFGEMLERPLRAETMQGPRTCLARSETIKPGATCECEIKVVELPKFKPDEAMLREFLDYAQCLGFGQWRNSGVYGQFEYELTPLT